MWPYADSVHLVPLVQLLFDILYVLKMMIRAVRQVCKREREIRKHRRKQGEEEISTKIQSCILR